MLSSVLHGGVWVACGLGTELSNCPQSCGYPGRESASFLQMIFVGSLPDSCVRIIQVQSTYTVLNLNCIFFGLMFPLDSDPPLILSLFPPMDSIKD